MAPELCRQQNDCVGRPEHLKWNDVFQTHRYPGGDTLAGIIRRRYDGLVSPSKRALELNSEVGNRDGGLESLDQCRSLICFSADFRSILWHLFRTGMGLAWDYRSPPYINVQPPGPIAPKSFASELKMPSGNLRIRQLSWNGIR